MTQIAEDARSAKPALAYRPCVGIALFDRAGRVFLGRRVGGKVPLEHAWQLPQGGIDPCEDPAEAALRELYEETNVAADSVTLLGEIEDWLAYDLPADVIKASWRGRYRGQSQKWFAFGFRGEDSEIDILRPGGGIHKAEFDAWRWEDLAATPGLIVPFKRGVYERVAADFARLRHWNLPA